jgi:hypothetical protein
MIGKKNFTFSSTRLIVVPEPVSNFATQLTIGNVVPGPVGLFFFSSYDSVALSYTDSDVGS